MKNTLVAGISVFATLVVVGAVATVSRGVDTLASGDCTPANRVATKDTYNSLALHLVYGRLSWFKLSSATPETISAQLDKIAALRTEAPEKVSDKCLLQEVVSWLDYYEREARGALEYKRRLGGYSNEYEKERAAREDARRALSDHLRAQPL